MTLCLGIELRTRVIIIGWLGVIPAIYALIIIFTSSKVDYDHLENNVNVLIKDDQALFDLNKKDKMAVFFSLILIYVLINASLIMGAYKKKTTFLVPWLAVVGLGIAGVTLVYSYIIASLMMTDFNAGMNMFYVAIFIFALYVYAWLCVFNLYNKLKKDRTLNIFIVVRDTTRLITNDPAEETTTPKPSEDTPPAYNDIKF